MVRVWLSRALQDQATYVIRTNGGLLVRRATKHGRAWELASDNPAVAVAPEPWPAGAEMVGDVVWMAQKLATPWRRCRGRADRQQTRGAPASAIRAPSRCLAQSCGRFPRHSSAPPGGRSGGSEQRRRHRLRA